MVVTMESCKSIELNECHKVYTTNTSGGKWKINTVADDPADEWSIGVFSNLDEARAALDSLRLFIKTGRNWNFHEYVKGQYNQ